MTVTRSQSLATLAALRLARRARGGTVEPRRVPAKRAWRPSPMHSLTDEMWASMTNGGIAKLYGLSKYTVAIFRSRYGKPPSPKVLL